MGEEHAHRVDRSAKTLGVDDVSRDDARDIVA